MSNLNWSFIYKKMKNNLFKIIFLTFFLTGCTQNNITSSGSRSFFSGNQYISNSSQLRLYRSGIDGFSFETELLPSGIASVTIPKNILSTDSEDRTKPNIALPVDFFLKIYTPDSTLPDHYFEIPVLGTPLTPSNVTTALSWILRWSFSSQLLFSKINFDQIVEEVELSCSDCRKKNNSEIVQHILNNPELMNSIKNKISIDNPTLDMNTMNYTPPPYEFIFSNQILTIKNTVKQELIETKNFATDFFIIDPKKSIEILKPISWQRDFQSTTFILNAENFSYDTTFTDTGFHLIKPVYKNISTNLSIELTVANKNRLPLCNTSTVLNFPANRRTQFSLSSLCSDPDPEDSLLIYNLKSAPPGLTILTSGNLQWLPNQAHYLENPNRSLTFGVTDPLLGYSEYTLNITISSDNFPVITFDGPNTILEEGNESDFSITTTDIDGDPVLLKVQAVTTLQSGLPAGSSDVAKLIRTGSAGHYTWSWKFTPSFLQTIGADGSMKFRFYTTYDPIDPNLDSTFALSEIFVDFSLTNKNDPPIWISQPFDFTATENALTTITFPADAYDPNPNSTVVSYTLATAPDSDCDWDPTHFAVSVVGGNVQLDLIPEYKSKRQCTFTLNITDSTGLSSSSSSFTVDITDTNQPISVLAGAPTSLSGSEMQLLDLQTQSMFEDLDFTDGDDDEYINWQCYLDQDQNGSYDDLCSTSNVNFGLSHFGLNGNWLPSAVSAGTYYVRLIVTDKGSSTAQHDFTITVAEAPAPLNLNILYAGLPNNNIIISENSVNTVTLSVAAATMDLVDNYNFVVLPGACSVITGSGNCPSLLLTPNGNFNGYGSVDFNMDLAPLYNNGDVNYPGTFKSYSYSFTVYKADQPTLKSDVSFVVQVNNTNRNPTNLTATGCTNCTLTDLTSNPITLTINAAADTKTGSNWKKTYSTTFAVVDPDLNDQPTIDWNPTSPVLGTFTDFLWSFKLPSCLNSSATGSVVRTLTFKAMDGRGGFYNRTLLLTIQKASASASCIQ